MDRASLIPDPFVVRHRVGFTGGLFWTGFGFRLGLFGFEPQKTLGGGRVVRGWSGGTMGVKLLPHSKVLVMFVAATGPENGHDMLFTVGLRAYFKVHTGPFSEPDPLGRVSGPIFAGSLQQIDEN